VSKGVLKTVDIKSPGFHRDSLLFSHYLNTFLTTQTLLLQDLTTMAGQVINHLNSIHARASHACGSAPQGMAERWAKDYVAGNYNRRQDELNSGATGYNNEGGASLIVRTHSIDTLPQVRRTLLTLIVIENRRVLRLYAPFLESYSRLTA